MNERTSHRNESNLEDLMIKKYLKKNENYDKYQQDTPFSVAQTCELHIFCLKQFSLDYVQRSIIKFKFRIKSKNRKKKRKIKCNY